jgi:XapX domain-containing protein
MNMKVILGLVLALAIGVVCRIAGVPLPAPPVLVGAMVVLSMTVGYITADKYLCKSEATQTENCAGPNV